MIKSVFPMCSCLHFTRLSCIIFSYKSFYTCPILHQINTMELKNVCSAAWILMFILPTVFCCDRCVHKSKVAYYSSSQPVNDLFYFAGLAAKFYMVSEPDC